jgi:hypothetical protein
MAIDLIGGRGRGYNYPEEIYDLAIKVLDDEATQEDIDLMWSIIEETQDSEDTAAEEN